MTVRYNFVGLSGRALPHCSIVVEVNVCLLVIQFSLSFFLYIIFFCMHGPINHFIIIIRIFHNELKLSSNDKVNHIAKRQAWQHALKVRWTDYSGTIEETFASNNLYTCYKIAILRYSAQNNNDNLKQYIFFLKQYTYFLNLIKI